MPIANPSKRLKLRVIEVLTDCKEVMLLTDNSLLPLDVLARSTKTFKFGLQTQFRSPQSLKATIYFLVHLYDGKVLAE